VTIGDGVGAGVGSGAGVGAGAGVGFGVGFGSLTGETALCVGGAVVARVVGCPVTAATGEVVCGFDDVRCDGVVWRGGVEIAGACTTLRPGPGPSAIPTGFMGDASSRGISAPPATAIASRSAARTRSFRLMFFPLPPTTSLEALSAGRWFRLTSGGLYR
jgi:hypothetical protein